MWHLVLCFKNVLFGYIAYFLQNKPFSILVSQLRMSFRGVGTGGRARATILFVQSLMSLYINTKLTSKVPFSLAILWGKVEVRLFRIPSIFNYMKFVSFMIIPHACVSPGARNARCILAV
jgi:hypothetical protein